MIIHFISLEKTLVEYFERYAEHFNIKPHFGQEVGKISPKGEKWQVKTKAGMNILADQVIVAAGVIEFLINLSGKGKTPSKEKLYIVAIIKTLTLFRETNTRYRIRNTGAEVALDLSEQGVDTTVVIRSPVSIVPRDLNGRPVQVTAKN